MIALRFTSLTLAAFVFVFGVGQSLTAASLCVRVTDPANLPLPAASVTAVNLVTAKLFTERTDRTGKSCLSLLPEGLYSVEVGLAGFLSVRYHPVRIDPVVVHDLKYQLPFGEISEGTLAQEATVSGTLKRDGGIVQSARICILAKVSEAQLGCAITNDLGEYAIVVPIGIHTLELQLPGGVAQRSAIDLSRPGFYRNVVLVTN